MRFIYRSVSRSSFSIPAITLTACTSSTPKPKGPGGTYQQAKQMFQQGNIERMLDLADPLASAKSDSPYNLDARVLEAVIFSGQVEAAKELADAYKKGSRLAKNPRYIAAFSRRRDDALQSGSTAALNLGQVALELTSNGSIPDTLILDAPWPSAEGPAVVAELDRISQGAWVAEPDQDAAALDAQRKGIDDALTELAGGDRSKARSAMMAGPVKLQGLDFAFFLRKEVENGAALFGRQYLDDPDQLKTLTGVSDRMTAAIESMLKQTPNKEKGEELKKLRDEIKTMEETKT